MGVKWERLPDVWGGFFTARPLAPSSSLPKHWFDLQMFAAEDEGRTEDPTGKRIEKARGEGQVAKSAEITMAVSLLVAGMIISLTLPRIVGNEMSYLRYYLENLSTLDLSEETLRIHFLNIGAHVLAVLWPIALAECVVAVGCNVAQVGWLFTWEPLRPKWNKLFPNPMKLVDRLLLGKTAFFNMMKSIAKIVVIGLISYETITEWLPRLLLTWGMTPYDSVELIVVIAWELLWKICLFLLAVAAVDYLFNRYMWKDSLKMKKEEVKDEAKQAEGDPIIKRAQRQKMMQVMRRRMMKEIPTADVVITNPTHYAIALKYDQATMTAPKCVAKGEGFLALKIRSIAEEHGVPCVENKPLAQAMYKTVEIGQEIPAEFYSAVAEVLAYVYRTKKATA